MSKNQVSLLLSKDSIEGKYGQELLIDAFYKAVSQEIKSNPTLETFGSIIGKINQKIVISYKSDFIEVPITFRYSKDTRSILIEGFTELGY